MNYPFAAVVGSPAARKALLLLAVEPELRGALIAAQGGSCSGTLLRAFAPLISRASIPVDGEGQDAVPFELPLNATAESLLGGLDFERTLATGKPQMSGGLLARANGSVLCAGNVNLLSFEAAAHLAQALDRRQVLVEREGFSATHAADFVFVGSFDPAEGAACSLLRDRVALIVESREECAAMEKSEIIDRSFRFDTDPVGFAEDFALETAEIKFAIKQARASLPRVRIGKKQKKRLALAALALGVEGNRADLFAVKTARAAAALAGRDSVSDEDLIVAIQLVLAPRATTIPAKSAPSENRDDANENTEPYETTQGRPCDVSSGKDERDGEEKRASDEIDPVDIADLLIHSIDARPPEDLLSQPPRTASRAAGKRSTSEGSNRGRYSGSVIHRTAGARVALDATLRAAAPHQAGRRKRDESLAAKQTGKRFGDYRKVKIEPRDLRFKRFKQRSGILFIFAVDASGSMALNRLAQAKGALNRLLAQAYVHRDKVALISFRNRDAEVLLAPTRSVELARRLVDALPAGGGTPISAGVLKALELARLARLRGASKAMLVLFTDGRANVSLPGRAARAIDEELAQLGRVLKDEGIRVVLVDTRTRFLATGEAEAVARLLGADCRHLPRFDAELIHSEVTKIARGRGNH